MAQTLATTIQPEARTLETLGTSTAPVLNELASTSPTAPSFDRDQAIREAAYACYEARGREPGHELEDWLKAEALLTR